MVNKLTDPEYPVVNVGKYIPEIVKDGRHLFGKLIVPLTKCPSCEEIMLKRYSFNWSGFESIFPAQHGARLKEQLLRAGILIYSKFKNKDDQFICVDCAKAGKDTFTCYLCEEERTSDLRETQFGDPPEYLCTVCYESVPAKVWDEAEDKLRKSHRYDFE